MTLIFIAPAKLDFTGKLIGLLRRVKFARLLFMGRNLLKTRQSRKSTKRTFYSEASDSRPPVLSAFS